MASIPGFEASPCSTFCVVRLSINRTITLSGLAAASQDYNQSSPPIAIPQHIHSLVLQSSYSPTASLQSYSLLLYCSNLRLLEEAGADLVFFSPIKDCLPANLAGLYLGGGYPEKYAQELSSNKMLLAAVKAFAEAGGVVYAECGGLIYLSQSIQPLQEQPVTLGEPFIISA